MRSGSAVCVLFPPVARQRGEHVLALHVAERTNTKRESGKRGAAAPFVREIIDVDQDACCQGARALNRVFELPDVPQATDS